MRPVSNRILNHSARVQQRSEILMVDLIESKSMASPYPNSLVGEVTGKIGVLADCCAWGAGMSKWLSVRSTARAPPWQAVQVNLLPQILVVVSSFPYRFSASEQCQNYNGTDQIDGRSEIPDILKGLLRLILLTRRTKDD